MHVLQWVLVCSIMRHLLAVDAHIRFVIIVITITAILTVLFIPIVLLVIIFIINLIVLIPHLSLRMIV